MKILKGEITLKKSTFLECVIAGAGAVMFAVGCMLASVNLFIPYLFAVLTTLMLHNTAVTEIIGEFKKSHIWKGNATIRKNFILLIAMLIIYWIIIFLFVQVKLIKA
ncbi:MAG TPA: hypothetical protein VHP31_04395 [Caproicibacter sp.]|nr:hypothetical protein [Caproicibacter sp.]